MFTLGTNYNKFLKNNQRNLGRIMLFFKHLDTWQLGKIFRNWKAMINCRK